MKKFSSADILLLREALANNGVIEDIYCLHEKYMLSPAQVSSAIDKFTAAGVIIFDPPRVVLSGKAVDWIIANRHPLFGRPKEWRRPPPEALTDQLHPLQPYRPNPRRIDRAFFRRLVEHRG